MPNVFQTQSSGAIADVTIYTANWNLLESSLLDLGPYVISGLVPSAGAGLSVSVTAGVANIGGHVAPAASFNISSLADNTTNHLYLLQTGIGTSNTTGTAPTNSVKLGTCVTAAGAVSSVDTTHASGRQFFVQPQNLILGGGAGHPRSANLAAWNATAGDGHEVYGTLPASAQGAQALSGLTDVSLSGTAQGDVLFRGASAWNNLAHGTAGQVLVTNGASANPSWSSSVAALTITGDLTLSTHNLITDTTTGTKLATSGTQKLGFWGTAPVIQPTGYSVTGSNATKTLAGDGTDTAATVGEVLGNLVKDLLLMGILHS